MPPQQVEVQEGKLVLQLPNGILPDRVLRPEDVSGQIIRHLVDQVKRELGGEIDIQEAVVTVPAYFTPAQRRATVEAAQLGGLKKVVLLQGAN